MTIMEILYAFLALEAWIYRITVEPLLTLARAARGLPRPRITRYQAAEIVREELLKNGAKPPLQPIIVKMRLRHYSAEINPLGKEACYLLLVDVVTGKLGSL